MRKTDLSLLDQMKFNDIEIEHRKMLMNFTREDVNYLVDAGNIIRNQIDNIVEGFYTEMISIDEIALIIGDSETLARLKSSQKQYILDLFSGYYDDEYVNRRLRIGLVHKRIGVEPKYYLTAISILKKFVFLTLTEHITDSNRLENIIEALDKLIFFDVTLVFDTYIGSLMGEIELSKNRTIEYARSLELKVSQRTKDLKDLSQKDGLTKIFNRRAFFDYSRKYLALAKRQKSPLMMVYFDIDNFKDINDTLGHLKGDEILISVASVLTEISRDSDIPARYGGDEFCVLLSDATYENAEKFSERLIKLFSEKSPNVSLSIGLAKIEDLESASIEMLISNADKAMYEAKSISGNSIVLFKNLDKG